MSDYPDPRLEAPGPTLGDRLNELQKELDRLKAQANAGVLGTDCTIAGSHDRLDALLGAGVAAPDGALVASLNADLLDGLHANQIDADRVDGLHASQIDADRVDGLHASEIGGTEQLWLDAIGAIRTQGTGTTGSDGPGSSKGFYQTMPDGQDTAYSWQFAVPPSWGDAALQVTVVAGVGGSGSIWLETCSNHVHAGESPSGVAETVNGQQIAVWSYMGFKVMSATITAGAAGTLQRLAIRRRSSYGQDNCTGAVYLYGLLIKKA